MKNLSWLCRVELVKGGACEESVVSGACEESVVGGACEGWSL